MGTIEVTGKGAVYVKPDVTRLEVTVECVFDDYSSAYKQASENTSWMSKILEFNHKPGTLAKTIRFDISDHEENDYDSKGHYLGKTIDGYEWIQVFMVDLPIGNELVNKIVRGVGKFIPGAQIDISYTVQDMRPVQLKMIRRAVEDAREKASIMAIAVGCQLGEVEQITYHSGCLAIQSQARSIHSDSEAKMSTVDSLNITPDDLVISDNIDVVWKLINQ